MEMQTYSFGIIGDCFFWLDILCWSYIVVVNGFILKISNMQDNMTLLDQINPKIWPKFELKSLCSRKDLLWNISVAAYDVDHNLVATKTPTPVTIVLEKETIEETIYPGPRLGELEQKYGKKNITIDYSYFIDKGSIENGVEWKWDFVNDFLSGMPAVAIGKFVKDIATGKPVCIITARWHSSANIQKAVELFVNGFPELKCALVASFGKVLEAENLPKEELLNRYFEASEFVGVSSAEFNDEFEEHGIDRNDKSSDATAKRKIIKFKQFVEKMKEFYKINELKVSFSDDEPKNLEAFDVLQKGGIDGVDIRIWDTSSGVERVVC